MRLQPSARSGKTSVSYRHSFPLIEIGGKGLKSCAVLGTSGSEPNMPEGLISWDGHPSCMQVGASHSDPAHDRKQALCPSHLDTSPTYETLPPDSFTDN